jgi:hypothetical protein
MTDILTYLLLGFIAGLVPSAVVLWLLYPLFRGPR